VVGATLVGLAFILPSFLMVLALAALYVRYGGLWWMQGAFYGIGAAVIAIIARSALKLVRMTIGRDRLLWVLFLVSALATAWTESESFWVFVGSGLVALTVRAWMHSHPGAAALLVPAWAPWLMVAVAEPVSASVLWVLFWFFAQAGLVIFGSGLAIVPFLHGGVVLRFQWLTERQFLDAVAVSMITPGPVVITVGFIGYLVAGLAGAVLAALGVFLPVYLVVVLAAPYFRRFAENQRVKAFVDGVTAAATGAIAGAAFVLGKRAFIDVSTLLIGLAALTLLLIPKRLPEPILIMAAGVVGLLIHRTSAP
jgi:chromate transporter